MAPGIEIGDDFRCQLFCEWPHDRLIPFTMHLRCFKLAVWLLAGCFVLPVTIPAWGQAKTTKKKTVARKKTYKRKPRGQQKIEPQRIREIQEALIRENYLTTKANGVWDLSTQAAMQKYQADNNWQSKVVPDSRALIKLGLGPNHDHLLNPESAMTTMPGMESGPEKEDPAAGSAGEGKHQ